MQNLTFFLNLFLSEDHSASSFRISLPLFVFMCVIISVCSPFGFGFRGWGVIVIWFCFAQFFVGVFLCSLSFANKFVLFEKHVYNVYYFVAFNCNGWLVSIYVNWFKQVCHSYTLHCSKLQNLTLISNSFVALTEMDFSFLKSQRKGKDVLDNLIFPVVKSIAKLYLQKESHSY